VAIEQEALRIWFKEKWMEKLTVKTLIDEEGLLKSILTIEKVKKDTIENQKKRTTSQLVFAAGLNNVVTDG
jgi:hypothetical protein